MQYLSVPAISLSDSHLWNFMKDGSCSKNSHYFLLHKYFNNWQIEYHISDFTHFILFYTQAYCLNLEIIPSFTDRCRLWLRWLWCSKPSLPSSARPKPQLCWAWTLFLAFLSHPVLIPCIPKSKKKWLCLWNIFCRSVD